MDEWFDETDRKMIPFALMLLVGMGMIGWSHSGLEGVLFNVGFTLVGLAVGRALR